MPNLDPTRAEVVRRAQEDRLGDFQTCSVGTVVAFYESTQEVDVQPAVSRVVPTLDGESRYEKQPVLPRVPVVLLGTERSCLQVSLVKGDCVLLVYSKLSTSEFLASGQTSEPEDLALGGLSSAFAIPFVRPGRSPSVSSLALVSTVQQVLDLLKNCTPAGSETGLTGIKTLASALSLEGSGVQSC